MTKLLVIADDFTGAMDTGVQFKALNTLVKVCSESSAMLLASKAKHIHFIPALPQMGRTTEEGLHYIDSVRVADIIAGQSCAVAHQMGPMFRNFCRRAF